MPDLSRLSLGVDAIPLSWSVEASRPVLSYWESVGEYAVAACEATGVQLTADDETERKKEASREKEAEVNTHLQWLRLCYVPSNPTGENDVELLSDGANFIKLAKLVDASLPDGVDGTVDVDAFTSRMRYMNGLDHKRRVRPPLFRPLGAEATKVQDKAFTSWLKELFYGARGAYSADPDPAATTAASNAADDALRAALGIAKGESEPPSASAHSPRPKRRRVTWPSAQAPDQTEPPTTMVVDHTIPRVWLKPLRGVLEFEAAEHDPHNISVIPDEQNRSKRDRPIKFGSREDPSPLSGVQLWAPPMWWDEARQGAAARIVVYMALVYPFICSDVMVLATGETTVGMPGFAYQFDRVVELATKTDILPWEERRNLGIYAHTKWCNPMVVSATVRTRISKPEDRFHKLLRKRLAGKDLGSAALLEAFKATGVQFAAM